MMKNQNSQENLTILLLGTGGTIAGLLENSSQATSSMGYRAAQLPIEALIPASKHCIITEQIAQIDSKNMTFELWEKLHKRLSEAQNDPSIDAIIITHGTDTLEETAYFLHRTLLCNKPVILTGAMRPADATDSDGPQNMAFALQQTEVIGSGVWVAFAGRVFSGDNVRKAHPLKLDAFDVVDDDFVPYTSRVAFNLPIQRWPRVEVVMSYAGACGELVEALIAQKVDGIMVSGTGSFTVHDALQAKLDKARKAGIAVSVGTRCLHGIVQSRIELILRLLS